MRKRGRVRMKKRMNRLNVLRRSRGIGKCLHHLVKKTMMRRILRKKWTRSILKALRIYKTTPNIKKIQMKNINQSKINPMMISKNRVIIKLIS